MKANEIRIGNWINISQCGINAKVDVIGIKRFCIENRDIDLNDADTSFALNEASPIVLTEETLLKNRFEIKPFSLGLTYDRFRFIWKPEYKYWYVVDRYSDSYLTKIEYVHELQNFIFVLNGKELEVNL